MPALPLDKATIHMRDLSPLTQPITELFRRLVSFTKASGASSIVEHSNAALHVRSHVEARQNNNPVWAPIPYFYAVDGPAPGAVVGIVLGSIAGFLFLCWLISLMTFQNALFGSAVVEEDIVVRRSPRSRHSRRSSHHEVRSYQSPRRETIIVDERRRSSPRPRPRSLSRSIIVEERERRVPGDDVVEVVEEESIGAPPRRHRSRRSSYSRHDYDDGGRRYG